MTGTVITDLRRRGAVDPSRVLTGPLRVVGLQWLDPGRSVEVAAEGVERALYITAGSGTATVPGAEDEAEDETSMAADSGIPLVEGTALTLPLGACTVLTAGTAGLEFFHAVLAVAGHPGGAIAHPAADRPTVDHPTVDHPSEAGPATGHPATDHPDTEESTADSPAADRPAVDRPAVDRPAVDRPGGAAAKLPEQPDHPDNPSSPKGGEPR
ncbi:hypothetical protein [Kitasatospora sp. NPDC093806]|uniref:hypothetical protein n=1 Tax=Kitasatospora sp. NPDC093806 TaxID=3155075 RepID=UPI003427A10C